MAVGTPHRHLKSNFGITAADYSAMLLAQAGVCAICGRPETMIRGGRVLQLAVDHFHETGVIRGLLCTRCNRGIGYFGDDPDRLEAAAAYLRRVI